MAAKEDETDMERLERLRGDNDGGETSGQQDTTYIGEDIELRLRGLRGSNGTTFTNVVVGDEDIHTPDDEGTHTPDDESGDFDVWRETTFDADGNITETTLNNDRKSTDVRRGGKGKRITRQVFDIAEGYPDVPGDTGDIKKSQTALKKRVLGWIYPGIKLIKEGNQNTTMLLDGMGFKYDNKGVVNGVVFDGKHILSIKNKKATFFSNVGVRKALGNFRELVRLADGEYKRMRPPFSMPRNTMESVIVDADANISSRISNSYETLTTNVVITDNDLRGLRGVIGMKYNRETYEKQKKYLKDKSDYWKKETYKNRGNPQKVALYESLFKLVDLKIDHLRLRAGEALRSEQGEELLGEQVNTNDLAKFDRFKKWAKENLGVLSAVAISIAGIITTVVVAGRGAVKSGAKAVSKFAKAMADLAKKFGPTLAALGSLLAKVLSLGAQGLLFLANNLWLLVLAFTYFAYTEYGKKRRKK